MAIILAIDDIEDNLITLNAIIRDSFPDMRVLTARSGQKGIEIACEERPDVILLDIVMPGMDGFDVCSYLKSDRRTEDIPVVFLTALKETRQNRIKALESGAEAFLSKPIDETELIAQVKAMLKIKQASDNRKDEKSRLEELVKKRTQALENELKERRRAESELRTSEEKFRTLVNEMQQGVAIHKIILNSEGVPCDYSFIDMNPSFEKLTGLKRDAVIGKRVMEVLPATESFWIERYGRVALTGKPEIFENFSGELGRYYSVVAFRNRINEFAVVIDDITDKIKHEHKLKTSDKIFNHVLDMICIAGFDGFFKELNPSWERELGWSREELLSKPWIEFVYKEDRAATLNVKSQIIGGEEIYQFENRYICKDGSIKWLSWNSYPYKEDNIMFGVARDVTMRKHEENIQQILYEIASASTSAKSLEDLLNIIRIKLNLVTDAGNFFVARYDKEHEMLHKVIFIDDKDCFTEWSMNSSLSGQVVKSGRSILMKRSDIINFSKEMGINLIGTECECWMGVPLKLEEETLGVMVLQSYTNPDAYDLRALRMMEMIAHELSIVIQRYEMIHNLIEAKERAIESDRLKSAFLANMSHEIRTPMNGIMGFLQLLNDVDLTSDDRQYYFDIITKSGERLLSTINDIIEISKIESGQLNVVYGNVNIKEILNFHYNFFKKQTDEKGISLIMKSGTEVLDIVLSDQHILDGILTNLIKNAVKFTTIGEIEFGTYLNENSLVFYVKDTGTGISKNRQEAIFDRFVQADLDYKRPHEGSGLGLSIVKAYADLINGKVWVESEEGRGSTFFFAVPYSPIQVNEHLLRPKEFTGDKGVHHKILIAEDDEACFKLMERSLAGHKFTVFHAWNGEEAVCMMKDNPEIPVILMDLRMPLMDGLDAAKKIRQFNKMVKIIAVTVNALSIDKEIALNSGCDDYVLKPVNGKILIDTIKRHLGKTE
ncbi:MAG: response regulator [Bacteroidales bacterium]